MSLGEYKRRIEQETRITRLLLHLNGSSYDSSGNNNRGTDSDITYLNGRLGGKYAYFNGLGYIQVPDHSSLNTLGDSITVSVWFNANNNISNGAYIVSKWSSSSILKQYLLFLRAGDNFLNFSINTSSGVTSVVDTEACETNTWKYVTGVYTSSTVKLYVDGVLKNQANATGQIVNPNPKCDLGIGALISLTTPSMSSRFKGGIDEVIIESRSWSNSEIKRYYTNTLGRFATI